MKTNKLEKRKEAEFKEEETKINDSKNENVLKVKDEEKVTNAKRKEQETEAQELKESYEMENRKAVDGTAENFNNVGGHLNKRTTF